MKTTIKNTAGISGLALLILASVSCDKNNPDNDRPTQFDLPAITAEITEFAKTKSLVGEDGIVKCSADDEIKVFVETQGTSVEDWEDVTHKYLTNANDCKSGLFKPETAYVIDNLDAKINMYVLNPWSDLVTDPVGDEESYSEFSYNGQIQDCNDITAHLSKYALMTGVAENVVAGQKPTVKMEHKSALLKFSVENQLRKPLTIQAVEITAPEGVNIAGTYKVDFKAGAPLVPVVPENKAMLTIRNGKVIGSDESMDIFIMTPPFSLSENQVIKLTVTSTEGEWEKVMTIPANIDIEAGSLNVTTIERNNYSVENI